MRSTRLFSFSGLFVLLVALVVGGCASSGAGNYIVERSLQDDMAQVEKPAPGMSKVVFIRPGILGSAIGINIFDGTKLVGHCRSNSYFQYECSSGKHIFAAAKENFSFVEADLLPDRIYYIKLGTAMGMWSARVNLWPLYPGCAGGVWNELPQWLANVTEVEMKPAAAEWEKDSYGAVIEKYNAYYEEWSKRPDRLKLLPEHGLAEPIQPQASAQPIRG